MGAARNHHAEPLEILNRDFRFDSPLPTPV
jgi:hypothetical protein